MLRPRGHLHLRAFYKPDVCDMAYQVPQFKGAHWTWWTAHGCVLACQLFLKSCYILQPDGQEGEECHGSTSHFQLLVRKDKQIEDEGESKANFLLSPACINERGCEVPVYEFRFC